MCANLDALGHIEWLLRTRTFTEAERDRILDLAMQGNDMIIYDKSERKFRKKVISWVYGVRMNSWWEDLFTQGERNEYAV